MTTASTKTFSTVDTLQKFASLAESLSVAEKECNKFRKSITIPSNIKIDIDQITTDHSLRIGQKCKNKMQQFRGKNSIFRRLEYTSRHSNNTSIPDHHKNPHKWTKYSLADISNEDMSDKSNTQAAFSFLNALKARKQINSCMEVGKVTESSVIKSKRNAISTIQFKKPNKNATSKEIVTRENGSQPTFKSSTVIMPEYVIGQKQKKKSCNKKKIPEQIDRLKLVKLNHLQELDEEKEEEC